MDRSERLPLAFKITQQACSLRFIFRPHVVVFLSIAVYTRSPKSDVFLALHIAFFVTH